MEANDSVVFVGTTYVLREVIVDKSGGINNAYVEKNETPPHPAMLVIRHWPEVMEIAEVNSPWMRALEGSVLTKILTFKDATDDGLANDVFHVAWVGDPKSNGYFQAIFIRFTKEKGTKGIKAYESSVAIDVHGPNWSDAYKVVMQTQFDALKAFAHGVRDRMPDADGAQSGSGAKGN